MGVDQKLFGLVHIQLQEVFWLGDRLVWTHQNVFADFQLSRLAPVLRRDALLDPKVQTNRRTDDKVSPSVAVSRIPPGWTRFSTNRLEPDSSWSEAHFHTGRFLLPWARRITQLSDFLNFFFTVELIVPSSKSLMRWFRKQQQKSSEANVEGPHWWRGWRAETVIDGTSKGYAGSLT